MKREVIIPVTMANKKCWRKDVVSIDPKQKGGYKFEQSRWLSEGTNDHLPVGSLVMMFDRNYYKSRPHGKRYVNRVRLGEVLDMDDPVYALSIVYDYEGADWAEKACAYIQTQFPHVPVKARKIKKRSGRRGGHRKPKAKAKPTPTASLPASSQAAIRGDNVLSEAKPEVKPVPATSAGKSVDMDSILSIDDRIKELEDEIEKLEARRMELLTRDEPISVMTDEQAAELMKG